MNNSGKLYRKNPEMFQESYQIVLNSLFNNRGVHALLDITMNQENKSTHKFLISRPGWMALDMGN